jgi:hypothetical protein
LQDELCFTKEEAMKQVNKNCGAHVSYTEEELLNRCNQLMEINTEEKEAEQSVFRTACVKAFLLLLLGSTLFVGKNSKIVNMLWLLALQDLDRVGDWSWGRM